MEPQGDVLRASARPTPIAHVIVCCQENHSFDHYYGTYPAVPTGYGIPAGFTQPNGKGGTVAPFHFTTLTDDGVDPNHDWTSIHRVMGQRADGWVLYH